MKKAIILLLLFCAPGLAFSSPVWFDDSGAHGKKTRHAHGGPVEVGRNGVYVKHLTMKDGFPAPQRAGEHEDLSLTLVYPDGSAREVKAVHGKNGPSIRFEMPREGFYNLYLVQREVSDNVLHVRVAKAEVLKHNCMEGHDRVGEMMAPRAFDGVPFEIVRQRLDGEDFHTNLTSGDEAAFTVLLNGKPIEGAGLRMLTEKGWMNARTTDRSGGASFGLIRDYYPPWSEFNKKRPSTFLVEVSHAVEQKGSYNGKPYSRVVYEATLPGRYMPSAKDYTSYLWGAGLTVFSLVIVFGAVFFYRMRRTGHYREDRFAEKD